MRIELPCLQKLEKAATRDGSHCWWVNEDSVDSVDNETGVSAVGLWVPERESLGLVQPC